MYYHIEVVKLSRRVKFSTIIPAFGQQHVAPGAQ